MKIVILHQHFNKPESGGPLRSYYLATALAKRGAEVVVITAGRTNKRAVENYEGIEIHWLPISYENRYGFYKRGYSFVRYALESARVTGMIKDVTYVYAISVPLTVGQSAIWIERNHRIPFIFEVGDLWPDAPVEMGFIQNPVLKKSLYWLEQKIYRQAKAIVALSEPIKKGIEQKISGKNIPVIPNMADTTFFFPEMKDEQLVTKFAVRNKFVVSYIGAIGFANGLDYLLECARATSKADLPVDFIICGEGGETAHLQSVVKMLKLENVHIFPLTNRQGVKDLLNVSDASFICYKPFPILETGSPNKYFDGLAAGKLIVINFKGWIKEEIEREKCGIALDSKNPFGFVSKIKPFIENPAMLKEYGTAARALAEKKYSRRILSEKFYSIFQNIGR